MGVDLLLHLSARSVVWQDEPEKKRGKKEKGGDMKRKRGRASRAGWQEREQSRRRRRGECDGDGREGKHWREGGSFRRQDRQAAMTSTFYSALDLIAWSLKGEGLNYAVSSGENGDEYLLTKIHSGRRERTPEGAGEQPAHGDGTGRTVPEAADGVVVHVSSKGVGFPLTISNSVREIVSKKWILPCLRKCISAAGSRDGENVRTLELRQALDDSKKEFYNSSSSSSNGSSAGSKLGGDNETAVSSKWPETGRLGNTDDLNRQFVSETPENRHSGSSSGRLFEGERMPGFEDEFQLQPGNRNDQTGPFGPGANAGVPGGASFGDFDLYPNGERQGHWGDPLGGAAGTAGGLGGIGGLGGMHPTFDDPLFRGAGRGGRRGAGGRGGFGPNIRYDDPTGGSGGF